MHEGLKAGSIGRFIQIYFYHPGHILALNNTQRNIRCVQQGAGEGLSYCDQMERILNLNTLCNIQYCANSEGKIPSASILMHSEV